MAGNANGRQTVAAWRIPQAVVRELLAHARAESPRECCGLLIGAAGSIVRSARARNLDTNATRYLIDPEDHFAAIRDARSSNLEVIGAYHSHPASAPLPSPTDIAEANSGADFVYLIVSLEKDEVAAFQMNEGKSRRLSLSVGS